MSGNGQLLFPSARSPSRFITDNTLNAALGRPGYAKYEVTAYGSRATAGTLLNEMCKWHLHALERQLTHVEGNKVHRGYARGDRWAERVKMMQFLPNYLDAPQTGAKILKDDSKKA